MKTLPTVLHVRVNADDRRLLECLARMKAMRLSTWARSAMIERSREELERMTRPEREK